MITKPNGWDTVKPYAEAERLPAGGYVLEIKQAKVENYGYGDTLVLSFDVCEGEYQGFYANQYRSQLGEDKKWKGTYRCKLPTGDGTEQDEWNQRRLKTITLAFQDSNAGYTWDWDETKLKGKKVGGVFNNKEYEFNGKSGFYTACHHLIDTESIRNGKFKIPKDTLLKGKSDIKSMIDPSDFEEVREGDLPF